MRWWPAVFAIRTKKMRLHRTEQIGFFWGDFLRPSVNFIETKYWVVWKFCKFNFKKCIRTPNKGSINCTSPASIVPTNREFYLFYCDFYTGFPQKKQLFLVLFDEKWVFSTYETVHFLKYLTGALKNLLSKNLIYAGRCSFIFSFVWWKPKIVISFLSKAIPKNIHPFLNLKWALASKECVVIKDKK